MAKGMLEKAALGDEEDVDMEDEEESADPMKDAFMAMAKAIKAGNLEEAWEEYQVCSGGGE